uniref:Uncharacterized protein n=1 Tax=Arundo donax TaxID=35708 RepID=A0A0A9BWG4_ARUDO
MGQFFLEIMHI